VPTSTLAAATYLRELLLRPGRPRRTWEQFSERARVHQINQLAVAEVLAHHLWQHPRKAGDSDLLPRQLKDTVARALSGKLLSRTTLELFMDAFALPEAERAHLRDLWGGSPRVRMLAGSGALRPDAEQKMAAFLGPPGHQTLSLHDHVQVAADGRVSRVRTIQVIEALRPGLDSIPYIYDTTALTLAAIHGCTPPAQPPVRVVENGIVTRIPLVKSLDAGETLTLEYATTFRYRGEITADQCEYRRAVMRRVENFDMRVQFDVDESAPDACPRVWWAVWNGVDGGIIDQHPAELDAEFSVHRYLSLVEKTVIGFHWSWRITAG
jgi:hypothetical protein